MPATIALVVVEVSISPHPTRVQIIICRVTGWLKENGGPIGLSGILLAVGFPLLAFRGVPHNVGWILLACTPVLLLLSIEWVQQKIPFKVVSRKGLTAEFWELAFEALPFPAFVKEYPEDSHIRDSNALKRFQGEKSPDAPIDTDLGALIQQDHKEGDDVAAATGVSVKLELTDKVPTWDPRAILTLKSRVRYDKRKYVIGCYVPVVLPSPLPSGESVNVAECGGQILFRYPRTAAGQNHLSVTIGKSVRAQHGQSAEQQTTNTTDTNSPEK